VVIGGRIEGQNLWQVVLDSGTTTALIDATGVSQLFPANVSFSPTGTSLVEQTKERVIYAKDGYQFGYYRMHDGTIKPTLSKNNLPIPIPTNPGIVLEEVLDASREKVLLGGRETISGRKIVLMASYVTTGDLPAGWSLTRVIPSSTVVKGIRVEAGVLVIQNETGFIVDGGPTKPYALTSQNSFGGILQKFPTFSQYSPHNLHYAESGWEYGSKNILELRDTWQSHHQARIERWLLGGKLPEEKIALPEAIRHEGQVVTLERVMEYDPETRSFYVTGKNMTNGNWSVLVIQHQY
jgi:hypothetical protein